MTSGTKLDASPRQHDTKLGEDFNQHKTKLDEKPLSARWGHHVFLVVEHTSELNDLMAPGFLT